MHCNSNLEGGLNFQRNLDVSQDQRLEFLFSNQNDSNSTSNTTWPKSLSSTDRHQNIDLLSNVEAHFVGPSDDDGEAASVRSDVPIPNEGACRPVFYFEIKIINGGDHSYIGIGLSEAKSNLNSLPGWRPNSYGYHGDDGRLFEDKITGRGKPYGPKFTTNDIVGCGYNVTNSSCFFTKNGKFIETAFKDLKQDVPWYPTIGMNSMGEKVEVNFGSKPFAFNIELENILQEAHYKDLKLENITKKAKKRVHEDHSERIELNIF